MIAYFSLIILKFNTGFIKGDSQIIKNRKGIKSNSLKTWFFHFFSTAKSLKLFVWLGWFILMTLCLFQSQLMLANKLFRTWVETKWIKKKKLSFKIFSLLKLVRETKLNSNVFQCFYKLIQNVLLIFQNSIIFIHISFDNRF